MTDYEYESETGMGDLALMLGWDAPTDDDGFWFREDHGPVHDSDLRPFVVQELQERDGELLHLRQARNDLGTMIRRLLRAIGRDDVPDTLISQATGLVDRLCDPPSVLRDK